MRFLLPAVLLSAACGSAPPPAFRPLGSLDAAHPAAGVGEIVVAAHAGDVVVETRAGEDVRVAAAVSVRASRPERTADPARDLAIAPEGAVLRIESGHLRGPDRDDWRVSLRVTAPPGLAVSVRSAAGGISLAGAFREVDLRAGTGAISVNAERLAGGKIRTGTGPISFETRGGPTGDLSLETSTGDISVRVPPLYGGRLNLHASAGRIDAGESLRIPERGSGSALIWQIDPEKESPGLWARTGSGDITFRRDS